MDMRKRYCDVTLRLLLAAFPTVRIGLLSHLWATDGSSTIFGFSRDERWSSLLLEL
jgi:hypothetical protein